MATSFNFKISLGHFFDFDSVQYITYFVEPMYRLNLISKSTGEIHSFDMTEAEFDCLLKQMELNIKDKESELHFNKYGWSKAIDWR